MTHRGLICWKTAMAILLCLLSIVASACGNAVLPDRAGPSATDEEVNDLVRGNNVLAFDLYRTLSTNDGNLFYSPYSISMALGMTYAGAGGETERQMADTLHFLLPQDTLHPAFNTLYLDLDSRSGGKKDKDPAAFRLNIANALWGRQGLSISSMSSPPWSGRTTERV